MKPPVLLAFALLLVGCAPAMKGPTRLVEFRRFPAAEARQGVAVDAEHCYAIADAAIGKYRKSDGALVARWTAPAGSAIRHLNAGVVVEGRLYCAHSNFPLKPDQGSVEVFDVATLAPVDRHAFVDPPGSLTWVVPYEDGWLACFAHYAPTSQVARSRLVAYGRDWLPRREWSFAPEILAKFGRMSCSGGGVGPDGRVGVTGHDARELYVLHLPSGGGVAGLAAVLPFPGEGQAFAWDTTRPGEMAAISRKAKVIILARDDRGS
jgi:hypothetical protein